VVDRRGVRAGDRAVVVGRQVLSSHNHVMG
jgi:hypothetical protein